VEKIRVLIVDDSVVVRRVLSNTLAAEPDIEVVGSAATASLALAKIDQSRPDVVTLDVELPDMNGLDLLTAIRKTSPRLPVIMFSALTHKAAATTLEALARGATDYVTKPVQSNLAASVEHVQSQLLPKIRALAPRARPTRVSPLPARMHQPPVSSGRIEVLAVGSSTGGPNALCDLFRALPGTLSVPIVVVQHMPPLFTRLLAERLTTSTAIPFREAEHGDVLEPGKGWIAPGDQHLRVVREGATVKLALDREAPENSCRPAVDVLFRSVAEAYGEGVLAVVLTGMGQDGLRGSESIRARRGQVIVQDEATSVVWGMPGIVARAGLAQAVLPLPEIAGDVLRRVGGVSSPGRQAVRG